MTKSDVLIRKATIDLQQFLNYYDNADYKHCTRNLKSAIKRLREVSVNLEARVHRAESASPKKRVKRC